MMMAMIFTDEAAALRETEEVKAWCAENMTNRYQQAPLHLGDEWAVTYPDGYPASGEIADINYVEIVDEGEFD